MVYKFGSTSKISFPGSGISAIATSKANIDALKKQIQEHARVAELFATAINEGMRTLKMDGIEKVLSGITDIKQVRSVCIK